MAKRTVIGPDEELIVKGKLRVTGDLIQENTTVSVTNLAGNVFTINSDSTSDSAILQMKSGLSGGGTGSLTYAGGIANVTTGVGLITSEPGFKGNLHIASGQSIVVSGGATLSGNVFSGNASGALAFTSPVTITLSGDTSGSATFINAGDTASITTTLATVNSNVGSFGDAATVPNFTVNAKGLVEAAGETAVNITASQISNFEAASEALFSVSDTGGDGSLSYSAGVFTYTGPNQTEANARITAAPSQVRQHLSVTDAGGDGSLTYNSSTGVFTYTGISDAQIRGKVSVTDAGGDGSLAYNSSTGVFTYTGISDAQIRGKVGVTNAGGDGSLAYNSGTGVFTYTGPSASEVRAHFTGGTGIDISSGTVAIDSTVVTKADTQTINGNKTFTGIVNLTGATVTVNTEANSDSDNSVASTDYVNNRINMVLGAAPAALDTLGEIATALNDDANIGGVVTTNTSDITTLKNRNINTGTGLSGGGNLTADRTLTTNDSEIVHDNLSGFVANEHIDHSGVTLTAGSGLTGGGDITTSRTFNIGAGTGITVNADSIQTNDSAIVHDNLSGFVANEHVDHSSVTLTAGNGLSGGGDITASRTFALDLNELTAATVDVANDNIAIIDANDSNASKKESIADLVSAIAGSGLSATNGVLTTTGFSGDIQSVDVGATGQDILQGSETLGNGTIRYYIRSIDGGTYTNATESGNVITIDGDINAIRGGFSASGLLSYNSGTGAFTTTADNYASWKFTTGSAGNVDISSNELLTFSGGSGISVSHSGSAITITNTNTADITGVSAGNGLTGGGTNGDVTLNAVGGYGITVNADNIEVSNSDIRGIVSATIGSAGYNSSTGVFSIPNSTSDISEGTNEYFTNARADARVNLQTGTNLDLSNKSTSDLAEGTNEYFTTARARAAISATAPLSYNSGTGVLSITEVGDISEVVAGSGLTGGATSGVATLNVIGGTGITVNADNIEITPADIQTQANTAIGNNTTDNLSEGSTNLYHTTARARAAISVTDSGGDGSLAYNSGTGVITYTGPNASQVRAHFSAGTGINISSGAISTDDGAIDIHSLSGYVANEHIDHSGVTLTAGPGLTGGGTIASSRSFTVGAGSYITVNEDDVAVDATTTNTANKVVARDASGNFAAGTITATATQAQYADLAENYLGDADYEPGTVLILGGSAEVTQSTSRNTPAIAGVVTTNPAHLMNEGLEGDHVVAVALRGRIPCKVKGPVRKGDVLIASDTPGHAEVAPFKGYQTPAVCVVGKAISEHLQISEGVVEILV